MHPAAFKWKRFLVSFCKLLVVVEESVHSKGNVQKPTFVGLLHLHLGSSEIHLFVPVTDVDRLREENPILSWWGGAWTSFTAFPTSHFLVLLQIWASTSQPSFQLSCGFGSSAFLSEKTISASASFKVLRFWPFTLESQGLGSSIQFLSIEWPNPLSDDILEHPWP